MTLDDEKRIAATAAAELVQNGMTVGLGTGSTVFYLLPAIAARALTVRCVSTSPQTEAAAKALGLYVEDSSAVTQIDLAIDGADSVSPDFWLIKGGGAAHTREKIVAAAAERFVVIVDSSKLVEHLVGPVPLELLRFGVASTVARLGSVKLRSVAESPDGGVIADWTGDLSRPDEVAQTLSDSPGVIEHGLFPSSMVSAVVVGRSSGAEWLGRCVED